MTAHALAGRVVVVVGDDDGLPRVVAGLAGAGASLAVVASDRTAHGVGLEFRADATDVTTLRRIAAHVEQRIGPIDVVVCDLATADAVDEVFAPDLRRRGHGEIVVVTTADEADDVVSLLVGRH